MKIFVLSFYLHLEKWNISISELILKWLYETLMACKCKEHPKYSEPNVGFEECVEY